MIKPTLLAIGGAHIDRRGVMTADFIHGASIPGRMIEETGGGVFNALRNAAQLGVDCTLISVRGGDGAGEMVAAEARRTGIKDLSAVFLDRATASYTALLERDGNVVAALADMSIYETALPRQISRRQTRDAIAQSDAVLIDANMPQEAIERLIRVCGDKPVFALAISPAKVVRLRPILDRLAGLFLNQREARSLLGLEQDQATSDHSQELAIGLQKLNIQRCILTNGEQNVWAVENGNLFEISPQKAAKIVDVTGAGDALAGAMISNWLRTHDFAQAIQDGLHAAKLTISCANAVADLSHLNSRAKPLAKTY